MATYVDTQRQRQAAFKQSWKRFPEAARELDFATVTCLHVSPQATVETSNDTWSALQALPRHARDSASHVCPTLP